MRQGLGIIIQNSINLYFLAEFVKNHIHVLSEMLILPLVLCARAIMNILQNTNDKFSYSVISYTSSISMVSCSQL